MNQLIVFGILSVVFTILSWRTLFTVKTHGFFRFFVLLCIAWLFSKNYVVWFADWLSWNQIISWILLNFSVIFVSLAYINMKKVGKPDKSRDQKFLFEWEKTTELVQKSVFKYIRHPMYSSLLLLVWGVFFKQPDVVLALVSTFASGIIIVMCYFDEKLNVEYFGQAYIDYKKKTHMLIPFPLLKGKR